VITFTAEVRVERAIEEVFVYVSDPLNFPRWNSAVRAVRMISGPRGDVGATYSIERELPGGPAANELTIVASERPSEFAMRTISGPTPFIYRYRFTPDDRATVVRLHGQADLGGVGDLLAPLARRVIRRGVDDNLATLKTILDTPP
jgi:hypothetical protein